MKTIYLLRHAKSDWSDSTLSDHQRDLNERGRRVAPQMAIWMKKYVDHIDWWYASDATRTRTTTKLMVNTYIYPSAQISYHNALYLASAEEITAFIRSSDDSKHTILINGHNEGITDFANQVGNQTILNIPTCGLVRIDFNMVQWQSLGEITGNTVIQAFPKTLGIA